jgi:hypothetical protein
MNKLLIIFTVILLTTCAKTGTNNTYERIGLLHYGISVNESKEILRKNKIKIIDEEFNDKKEFDTCIIKTNGTYYNKKCDIEYHFFDDKLTQGFYRFNTIENRYYSAKEIEDIKQMLMQNFTKKYSKEPVELFPNSYYWESENKIQIGLVQIADDILVIENIGIYYLLNLER